MTKNFKVSLIVLMVLIGIYFLNNRSQGKLDSTSTAIFLGNPEDIDKKVAAVVAQGKSE